MSRRLLTLLAAASLLVAGCSTFSDAIDAINPFAASGPKMAPLTTFEAKVSVRDLWLTKHRQGRGLHVHAGRGRQRGLCRRA